jgi:hypothetical protein
MPIKIIGPFFNHNPVFGFESDGEDMDLEDGEEMEALGVNCGEKSGAQVKDSMGKESKGTEKSDNCSCSSLMSFI